MLQSKNIPSLTADEPQALRNHKQNTEVVIREADKWSAVAVISHERYIAEAYRQLSDTDVYQQVSSTVFFDVIEEVKDILPSTWLRYIDDIFIIWNESEDKLRDFFAYINTVNPAIPFTHTHSIKSVNFLDVLATLTNDGTI